MMQVAFFAESQVRQPKALNLYVCTCQVVRHMNSLAEPLLQTDELLAG